ncbi:uncharacterized protein LOC119389037 [Rhipicephalus sanguineus]|uniref:uncharacterized protein LOC119389037 n=1 Tax=Rhipicephalus sanguineus TaxID=34632 RepID=UPI0018932381|nr:uncharacterized protein LOC119389037 [Rhipicephalus sanguineus]
MMHFDRYRGIASGIKNLGGTAGSVVLPILMLFIQGHYGFRACLFLYGGLAMHLTPLGMLTKEPPWSGTSYKSASSNFAATPRELQSDYMEACEKDEEQIHCDDPAENSRKVPGKQRLDTRDLFVNPVFYVIVLSGVIGYYTQNIFFATIVDFARDKGFSLMESAGVMLYFGFTETVGRLCFPLAADRGLVRHSTLMAFSFVAMAASMILLERGGTLLALTAGASLFAAFFGAAVTVEGVVIANYLGVDSLSFVFGFTGAISVPFFFANPFILGFFRDHVGSYQILYKILAASYFLVGLAWTPVLWCDRYGYSCCRSCTPCGKKERVKDVYQLKQLSDKETKSTDVVDCEATSSV